MKKLITVLSALTITSSITPLVGVYHDHTNAIKSENHKDDIIIFNDQALKKQIKSQIESILNQKDNGILENATKISIENSTVELDDSDISINGNDVTIKGQFILNTKLRLTSSKHINDEVKDLNDIDSKERDAVDNQILELMPELKSKIISNPDKKLKGEPIDITKITAEEILNFQKEYAIFDDCRGSVDTPEKLANCSNYEISCMLKRNSECIIMSKVTGIKEDKKNMLLSYEDPGNYQKNYDFFTKFHFSDYLFYPYVEFCETRKDINYEEYEAYHNFRRLFVYNIKLMHIKASFKKIKGYEGTKVFEISVVMDKWNSGWDDEIENEIKEAKLRAEEFLMWIYENKEKERPNECERKHWIKYYRAMLEINIDSVKAVYDLFKTKKTTIEIELPLSNSEPLNNK